MAYDYGLKENILRRLRQNGFGRHGFFRSDERKRCARIPTGRNFLSNGPGDPAGASVRAEASAKLDRKKPIFGICLDTSFSAMRSAAEPSNLKFGHRGGNQPVKDLRTGKVAITSQNHGFAV